MSEGSGSSYRAKQLCLLIWAPVTPVGLVKQGTSVVCFLGGGAGRGGGRAVQRREAWIGFQMRERVRK